MKHDAIGGWPAVTARLLRVIVSAVSVILLVVAPAMPAGAALRTDLSQPELTDRVAPSLVQVGVKWEGRIYYLAKKGWQWSEAVTTGLRCSGFFVSANGYVVTNGYCVDPVEGKKALIDQFLFDNVDDGTITQQEADGLIPDAYDDWKATPTPQRGHLVSQFIPSTAALHRRPERHQRRRTHHG